MAIDPTLHEIQTFLTNGNAKAAVSKARAEAASPNIIDIRSDTKGIDILDEIHTGLKKPEGKEKQLPTLLLYDAEGLKLFEGITFLDEYYLTAQEIQALTAYADRIAQRIPDGAMVIELGSGNLRKVNIILLALERLKKNVEYYALDLSLSELQRTLADIPHDVYKHVKCFGLWGTYDDGLRWIQQEPVASKPKSILWLGSSIGNFTRESAVSFLQGFSGALRTGDTMLIGIDACKDPERVYHAYNDREGLTHRFILNGLTHANRLLGSDQFQLDSWQVIGEYDTSAGRHHAFVSPLKDVVIDGVLIRKGERVRIEESYKWSDDETQALWEKVGFVESAYWSNRAGDYALHMMTKPTVHFPSKVNEYVSGPVPSLAEWHGLWNVWDTVTRGMLPDEELLNKPIKLRNACIFYLGHIPTFLDIHLTRATAQPATEPARYQLIFERGIDPDVDNPELCHAHSEIPDTWPPLDEILTFQDRVRERVAELYADGRAENDRKVARALWIGFEHEIMHLETLLYMLVQSEKTLPPPGTIAPDFESIAKTARLQAVKNEWFTIPERTVSVGLDDNSNAATDDDASHTPRFFGWDIENPRREVKVGAFAAQSHAITNREYARYLIDTGSNKVPASWATTSDPSAASSGANGNRINGHSAPVPSTSDDAISRAFLSGKAVRTVYGLVPLEYALDWPLAASYDEVAGCAKFLGGRVPTADEVRSIYEYVDELKKKDLEKSISTTIPAVNGHLVNDGVEETPPPTNGFLNGGHSSSLPVLDPHSVFADLQGANVGFAHWHPMPAQAHGNTLAGRAELGGVWEWTSTVLEPHDGFEAMHLYPGYTADFFDGKHNVVLGGSWATHPRIAGRKTFVNWYQRNYPYVWAGARLVKDL